MQEKEYLYVRSHRQQLKVSTTLGYYSDEDKVSELIEKINTSMNEKIKQCKCLIEVVEYFGNNHPPLQTSTLEQSSSSSVDQWLRHYRDEFPRRQKKAETNQSYNGLSHSIERNFLAGKTESKEQEKFANYFMNHSILRILDINEAVDHGEFYDPTTPRYPESDKPSIVDWERACRFLLRYIYHENTNRDLMDDYRLSIEELYPLLSRVPVQIGMDPRHAAVATSIYKSHMSGQVQGDLYPQSLEKNWLQGPISGRYSEPLENFLQSILFPEVKKNLQRERDQLLTHFHVKDYEEFQRLGEKLLYRLENNETWLGEFDDQWIQTHSLAQELTPDVAKNSPTKLVIVSDLNWDSVPTLMTTFYPLTRKSVRKNFGDQFYDRCFVGCQTGADFQTSSNVQY